MKKIAVYTWCYDIGKTNYGQILQCYATQEMLRKLGYAPTVLRYRKPLPDENIFEFKRADKREKYEREYRIRYIEGVEDTRIDKFFEFITKNINCTIPCYTEEELKTVSSDAEVLVCGSDQLWAPEMYDPVSLLRFTGENQKRISYATSGLNNADIVDRQMCKELSEELQRFAAVSVRENSSKNFLEKLINKEVEVVLDPTLLLPDNIWKEICTPCVTEEKYILAFFLGPFTYNKIVLKELMRLYKVDKVLYIKSSYFREEGIVSEGKFIEAVGIGPREFLSLIKNAEAIYTDSYHGSVFSVIFHKQFYVVNHRSPYRINELCENLKIGNRRTESIRQLEDREEIDYRVVDKTVDVLRNRSIHFLRQNIGE